MLLTDLWPFYDMGDNDEPIQRKIKLGIIPFVDPRYRNRSIAEAKFVEIIESCWNFNPRHRPAIETVAQKLREALDYARSEPKESKP